MRATLLVTVVAGCTVSALVAIYGAPPRSANSLTEEDLIKLIKSGASANALVTLVVKYGISFHPDEHTLERLKKEGAPDLLLDAIRPALPAQRPKAPEPVTPVPSVTPPQPAPRQDPAKVLEAERHLKLSQLKAQDKAFDAALAELAEAEKIRPQWEDVFYERGLILAELHRYGEASNEWKKYLAVAGPEADAKAVQDKIVEWEYQAQKDEKCRQLKEVGKQDLKDFNGEGAIAAFQEVVRTQPSLENLLLLAEAFWTKRDYGSLSKTATQALALDQNSARAVLYQGAAQLGLGNDATAVSSIERGINLDPELAFGYELYCDALRLKGDSKNAWMQCQRALQINANSGFAHNRLGWILWNRKKQPEGLVEIRKATEVEPANAYWQSDLAYALVPLGDIHAAFEAAHESLRLDAKCPYSHDAMGLVLEAQGKYEQAILEFNEAIRLAPLGHTEFLDHLNQAERKSRVMR